MSEIFREKSYLILFKMIYVRTKTNNFTKILLTGPFHIIKK